MPCFSRKEKEKGLWMDHQQCILQEDKLLILKLFTFKFFLKKETTFNSKIYIHNTAHLSGYEKGSLVFSAFRDIFSYS